MILQRFTPFVLFLLIALAPLAAASAQELPATPIPAKAPLGVLARFSIAELPTPHAEVWFLRMGLKPGGSLPLGKQIGPVVAYVESGELTLSSDRPVTVSVGVSAGSTATAIATPTAGEYKTVLGPGASALIDDGVTLTAKNVASEATPFLVVSAYAAERENESSADSEPVGLTQQAVSIAGAEFPVGPGKLTIERVVVELGGSMASDSGHGAGIGGIDLGAVEQGSANVAFRSGSSWLWPNFRDKPQDREPIGPGAKMTLAAGDGYSTYDGASNWTVTSNEPLIVLRVVIMPGSGD